jgi:uncharacterized membrane-anchored protein YhcB (DUF1043 family)
MIYLISQQFLLCLICLLIGVGIGWILWGLAARQHAGSKKELAQQNKALLSLQEQAQKDRRRLQDLEAEADSARKLAAKKESSVSQLIADKGSLLADVKSLQKELTALRESQK